MADGASVSTLKLSNRHAQLGEVHDVVLLWVVAVVAVVVVGVVVVVVVVVLVVVVVVVVVAGFVVAVDWSARY